MKNNTRLLSIHEEVEEYGTGGISSVELLAELIEINPKIIDKLVKKYGSIQKVCFNASYNKDNISEKQTYKLKILGELLKRNTFLSTQEDKIKVNSPNIVANIYMQEMRHLEVEHFDILLLNTKNNIIKKTNISKGILNFSISHPREVFKEAIRNNANSIILLHNHPSGDPSPSPQDIELTRKLIQAGNIIGIKVLDHIIFGDNKYCSMKKEQYIEF